MNIQQTKIGGTVVLSVKGVIRLNESGKQFSDHLKVLLETGIETVLVDLSEVDEIDSTGLGELVGYLQLFSKQGRRLVVVKPTAKVQRLFEFMNLHKVLPIFDDIDQRTADSTVSSRYEPADILNKPVHCPRNRRTEPFTKVQGRFHRNAPYLPIGKRIA